MKTITAVRWSFLSFFLRRLVIFGVFILISRVLTKADLGIFREFALIIAIPKVLSSLSLEYLLVLNEHNKKIFSYALKAVFITGSICAVLLLLLSDFIGSLYHSKELTKILYFSPLILIIEIYRNLFFFKYKKELWFKKIALYQTLNVIIYSMLLVIFINFFKSFWILIITFYFGDLMELIFYFTGDFKANLTYIKKSLKTSFSQIFALLKKNSTFLSFTTINNLLNQISGNAPVLIMGMFFSVRQMGVFYLANQIVKTPLALLTRSLSQVFFPVLAKMEKKSIKKNLERFLFVSLNIVYPLIFIYIMFLIKIIPVFFGEKWVDTIPLVKILGFLIASILLFNPLSSLPTILKKTNYELVWTVATLLFRGFILVLGAQFGFSTAIVLYVVVSFIMHFAFEIMSIKLFGFSVWFFIKKYLLYLLPNLLLLAVFFLVLEQKAVLAIVELFIAICLVGLIVNLLSKNRLIKEIEKIIR